MARVDRLPLSLLIWAAAPALRLLKAALAGHPALTSTGNGSCSSLADEGAYTVAVLPVQALAVAVVVAAAIQVGRKIADEADSLRTVAGVMAWGTAVPAGTLLVVLAPRVDSLSLVVLGAFAIPVMALRVGGVALAGRRWPPVRRREIALHVVAWFIGTIAMAVAIGGTGEVPVC